MPKSENVYYYIVPHANADQSDDDVSDYKSKGGSDNDGNDDGGDDEPMMTPTSIVYAPNDTE